MANKYWLRKNKLSEKNTVRERDKKKSFEKQKEKLFLKQEGNL